ncbi:YxiG family protein [Neobacillus sp. SM06]|uniref:YxiG family protein n=1 Tax=Neobacillus sp. SM06 TaxID=3422492 RepID=UPI003D28D1CE
MKVNKDIQKLLNNLWGATIESIDFQLISDKISLMLTINDNEIITKNKLEFCEISSYYYLKDTAEDRFNLEEIEKIDYLELTSIDYYPEGIGMIKIIGEKEWIDQYYSNANFALEIWNSLLFIEAKVLILDKRIFKLK